MGDVMIHLTGKGLVAISNEVVFAARTTPNRKVFVRKNTVALCEIGRVRVYTQKTDGWIVIDSDMVGWNEMKRLFPDFLLLLEYCSDDTILEKKMLNETHLQSQ
jgi:hypothetical protein